MNGRDQSSNSDVISRRRVVIGGSMGLLTLSAGGLVPTRAGAEPRYAINVADQVIIKRLIYRYAMAVDNLDVAAMAECFAPNAVLRGGGLNLTGNIASDLMKRLKAERSSSVQFTLNIVLNHWYEVQGSAATGLTYCVASSVAGPKGKWTKVDTHVRYDDDLVKQGDRWLFLKRQYQPLFVIENSVIDFATYQAQMQE